MYCLDKIWEYCILLSKANKMIFFNPVYVYIWSYSEAADLKLLFLFLKTLWKFFLLYQIIVLDTKCLHRDLHSMCSWHELNQKTSQICIFNAETVLCNKEFWLELLKGDDRILKPASYALKGKYYRCVFSL